MRWLVLLVLSFTSCGLIAWPGRPCSNHDDCSGLKDGYCSKAEICTRRCSDAKPCPEGSTCTTAGGAQAVCLHTCATNEDCGSPNFVCSQNVCLVAAPMEPPPK